MFPKLVRQLGLLVDFTKIRIFGFRKSEFRILRFVSNFIDIFGFQIFSQNRGREFFSRQEVDLSLSSERVERPAAA